MSKEDFMHCVSRFELYEHILEYHLAKTVSNSERMKLTDGFRKKFIMQQRETLNNLIAQKDEVEEIEIS